MNTSIFVVFGLFLLFCVVFDFAYKKTKIKKLLLFCLIITFCFYAAFRPISVPDTEPYISYFDQITQFLQSSSFFTREGTFDVAFEYFTKLIVALRLNYQIWFFVITLLNCLIISNIFKNNKYILLPTVLFISFFGFYFSFIILRAGISVVLTALAILKFRKKPFLQVILFILAYLFHASALFAIVLYFCAIFAKRRVNVKFQICVIVGLMLFSFFGGTNLIIVPFLKFINSLSFDNPLWERFLYYADDLKITAFTISKRQVFEIFIFLLAKFITSKNNREVMDKNAIIIDRYMFIGVCVYSFLGNGVLMGRISDFLLIFNIINMLKIIDYVRTGYSNKLNHSICNGQNIAIQNRSIEAIAIAFLIVILNLIFIFRIFI